jgi:Fungal specific transcription factor domain
MQVVWEANTADFAKRKRAARACAKCQKRKKRCHHTFANDSTGDNLYQEDLDSVLPNLAHQEPIRFVGDLNAESILTDLSRRSKGAIRQSRVGTWVEPSEEAEQPTQDEAQRNIGTRQSLPQTVEKFAKTERSKRTITLHEKQYLQAVGAFRVLPQATQEFLVTSYIRRIDSLLPIIDGSRFLQEYVAGTASIFLVQAMCMVTCKSEEASPYLRLTEEGPLISPIRFARALYTGLNAAMKADLEFNRLTEVQILALMSLHNDGPGGLEESSMHLAQAIHNAHSAGLHILTSDRRTNDEASYTWWSLWVLDKFNSCLGGRAIMIADRDIGIPRPEIEADEHARSRSLAVWLALASLLSDVISFYRPTSNPDSTGWETDFPTFGSLTEGIPIPNPSYQSMLHTLFSVPSLKLIYSQYASNYATISLQF